MASWPTLAAQMSRSQHTAIVTGTQRTLCSRIMTCQDLVTLQLRAPALRMGCGESDSALREKGAHLGP